MTGKIQAIRESLRRAKLFILGLWTPADHLPRLKEKTPKKTGPLHGTRRGEIYDQEARGAWYFRRDLLDRLDDYFEAAKLMKKAAPQLYEIHKNIGAVIFPKNIWTIAPGGSRDAAKADNFMQDYRPGTSFGAIFLDWKYNNDDHPNESITCDFCVFQRLGTSPADVQPTPPGWILYCVATVVTYRDRPKEKSFGTKFYVAVSPDGEVRLLRERQEHRQRIPISGSVSSEDPHKSHGLVISHRRWQYPEAVVWNACQRNKTPQRWAHDYFEVTYNLYQQCNSDVRVRVEKGDCCASFAIDMLRTPNFFSDRDFVPASDGRRKRIFHIVRVHARKTRRGKTMVRTHFRGIRRFDWHGYKINITVPGLHHSPLPDFHYPAYDADQIDDLQIPSEDVIPYEVGAKKIGRHLNK